MIEKIIFAWSGGKDSALALYELQQIGNYEILALMTTITEDYGGIYNCLNELQSYVKESENDYDFFCIPRIKFHLMQQKIEEIIIESSLSKQSMDNALVTGDIYREHACYRR